MESFAHAHGGCVITHSGAMVTIAITGEGVILGVAYQGKNYLVRVSSEKPIIVNNLADIKDWDPVIKEEVQQVIKAWHIPTLNHYTK
ncbi:MAG: hypothetical protein CW346_11090 [Bacillaceae bacterium]|nr:hypothetical protein [Bacillaceae bacterium]